jgi:hypothetical protein
MESLVGFPFWQLEFDGAGNLSHPEAAARHLGEIAAQSLTDLIIFSHGWNNDHTYAHRLYERFFTSAREALTAARGARPDAAVGIVGVFWPSILFPDDEPAADAGGLASFDDLPEDRDPIDELKKAFPDQTAALEEMRALLRDQPRDADALGRFQGLLEALAPDVFSDEGSDESAMLREPAEKVFEAMSELAPPGDRPATAGFGDEFGRLWAGAKEALRATSYWTMKERAGQVGERGLGPFIASVHQRANGVRVHLVGHSFGARVVSFALKGLPASFTGDASPVKSLMLIQGAFSHFAFAERLPHDDDRSGALHGMAARVDGPIVVTHSEHDLAVSKRYPQASFIRRQDSAGLEEVKFRFGGMGWDGAQAVGAIEDRFKPVGARYQFGRGAFLNLDGNDLITKGDPPSGAHSDIFHPEIAWVALHAAGVAAGQ